LVIGYLKNSFLAGLYYCYEAFVASHTYTLGNFIRQHSTVFVMVSCTA